MGIQAITASRQTENMQSADKQVCVRLVCVRERISREV